MYRHFHVYITPAGTLGMELRNTDSEFKYTMSAANVISSGTNRIAFKADAANNTYKLFANGAMVGELEKDDFKFFGDITGLSTISLGGTIRNQTVGYPFGGTISHATVYNGALGDNDLINMTRADDAAWIDKSDISITSGEVYDLSDEAAASEVYGMDEGTIFVEYESTSSAQYQSLFSVSNPGTDTGDMYRHFHVYVTPTGTLGMELRNTDSVFKYTMAQSGVLNTTGLNKIAFKADAAAKTYKLFANGSLVGELTQENFKFFGDITGLSTISLGGTVRNQAVAYPFGGTIARAQVYGIPLDDASLVSMTTIETDTDTDTSIGLVLEKSNIEITDGSYQDLSAETNAQLIESLSEGTIVMSFTTTSTNGVQSLISVGKLAVSFLAFVHLASIWILLK